MAISTTPRSVVDATRFTQTTPHASVRAGEDGAAAAAGAPSTGGNNQQPAVAAATSRPVRTARPAAGQLGRGGPQAPRAGGPMAETPEQRVRRLRAAHLAAKNAEVSRFDRVVDRSRGVFDKVHRLTLGVLIGFTAIAGFVTVFTVVDMARFNGKRRAEFIEAQKHLDANSLEAARLAYIAGTASAEQMTLIERAEQAAAAGGSGGVGGGSAGAGAGGTGAGEAGFKLPPILGRPTVATGGAKTVAPAGGNTNMVGSVSTTTAAAATAAANESWVDPPSSSPTDPTTTTTTTTTSPTANKPTPPPSAWRGWFGASLRASEEGDAAGTSQRRLGWDSLSEEDDGSGVRDSDLARAVEEHRAAAARRAREEAAAAMRGEDGKTAETKKRGWLW